jgi:hypothetical protein
LTGEADFAGLRTMRHGTDQFEQIVVTVVTRFFAQNSHVAPPDTQLAQFAAQLSQLVVDRGLPAPLAADEVGTPGGMAEEECARLVERVLAGLTMTPLLADAARQLVKACFYPEFKTCRDSFRETGRDGVCRRQELSRARGRISGSHCVDCPHWIALTPAPHEAYLASEWHGDQGIFFAHRAVFLPEDFRALRQWLHAAARS